MDPAAGMPESGEARPLRALLGWILVAAACACAGHLAAHHPTPVDRALPFLAVIATLLAAISYPSAMLAVPLLLLAEIAIPDETTRLLAFGAIFAVLAGLATGGLRIPRRDASGAGSESAAGSILLAMSVLLLLRWIPFEHVLLARELVLLGIAALIVLVLGSTPFAVTVAVIAVFVTPAVPLRTLGVPLAVLFVAAVARVFGMPRIALRWPSAIALGFLALFFAWSGVVARAFPHVLRPAAPDVRRLEIRQALPPRAVASYDVPENARALVISGANVAGLRRGTPLARMEPGGVVLRIGDASDWGFLRREHFYGSRNPLPRDTAGSIRGYGYTAWLDGAGRVALPPGARTIRLTVEAALPADASLQVEGFEIATR